MTLFEFRRVESDLCSCTTGLRLFILISGIVGLTGGQLLSEFESSKDPVTDIFGLVQLLKKSNANPGSHLNTVMMREEIFLSF